MATKVYIRNCRPAGIITDKSASAKSEAVKTSPCIRVPATLSQR